MGRGGQLFFGFCVISLFVVLLALPSDSAAPTRADCIAGAHLRWPSGFPEHARVVNAIPTAIAHMGTIPIAGMAMPTDSEIYVIFRADCDARKTLIFVELQPDSKIGA